MMEIDASQSKDYQRVEKAIDYIREHLADQPGLARVAEYVGLSPYHFQRLFRRFAGVSPKRFMEFLTVGEAKQLLAQSESVLSVSDRLGLSSPARLHDHFVSIEAVTPGDFKRRGQDLEISYGFGPSPFGEALAATTTRGICALSFVPVGGHESELRALRQSWPAARLRRDDKHARDALDRIFSGGSAETMPLALRGTNFQIRVWNALLQIPTGTLKTYRQVAIQLDAPRSARAVATAIGANPVAFLIPCHRVIRGDGTLGGYRWGESRKAAIIGWEQFQGVWGGR